MGLVGGMDKRHESKGEAEGRGRDPYILKRSGVSQAALPRRSWVDGASATKRPC